jgi:ketosteroid isomerase-like protein
MAIPAAVSKASKAFYSALNQMANGDASAMAGIWSHTKEATSMHPIGGREVGWTKIRGPWAQVAQLCSGGKVALKQQKINVSGTMACETGMETGHIIVAGSRIDINHRVTNVYRREGGSWKIVHHHTDLSQPMIDLLARLQAPPA